MQTKFVGLNVLAQDFGLPATYLRDLAISRKIPSLNVRGKLRFDPDTVTAALDKLAMGEEKGDNADDS
jgi:hypothetical protein